MPRFRPLVLRLLPLAFMALLLISTSGVCQQITPRLYEEMRWRMIGPFRGGRTLSAVGVPGQADTFYFGAVAGGVWKTTNGGETWAPIFDSQPIASIGAIAVAPSDPKIIYVGSGEADMRSDISFGNGVYKSTDSGHTWTHLGLTDSMQIGRILVDARNPDVVLVAALGHAYGANPERGVFRSSDGGHTWQKVLYKDENTGAIELAADPDNPQVIYAALWNVRRVPWSRYSPVSGPGSGLYKSADGGQTWRPLSGGGLPGGDWGRVGLAVGRGKGIKRIYALIDAPDGGLFRCDDEGKTWELVGSDKRIRERAWYFSGVTVDPKDPDVVYVSDVALYRSTDGGKSFEAFKGAPGGDDYHSLWIDPQDSRRMILAADQGAAITVDGGESWSSWYNQPTAQLYHVTTDHQFPYYVYGAQQDSGTVATTSRSDFGSITFRDWYSVGAGEGGYLAPDPSDPNIVYGGDTRGTLFRFDRRTGQSQEISPAVGDRWDLSIRERKLRFTWTSPLVFSPFDAHTLYFGSQYLLITRDRGTSWQIGSPDLTGASPEAQAAADPLTPTQARQQGWGVIYTIAPSAIQKGLIWVGTDTGLIHLTRDEGKTWTAVAPPGLSDYSKVSIIEASHFDAATAYAAIDRHRLDDYQPYIYRSHDFGKTWTKISSGIAAPAYVHAVREDPLRRGLLYAGTETGVYVSFDDGDHWQSLQLNLPVAPVHDLVVKDNDLVAGTHGRSFWILDDLSPLRQARAEIASSPAHLFRPQTAIRMRHNVNRDTPLPAEIPAGQNPPAGAIIDYYLANESAGDAVLELIEARGAVVRRFSSSDREAEPSEPPPFSRSWLRPLPALAKTPGMHRLVWDLRYPAPPLIHPEYSMAVAFGQNTPPAAQGPLVLPGEYQVRLTVAGRAYTQPLKIEMDPRVGVGQADLARQFELETGISGAMVQADRMYRRLGELRASLQKVWPAATGASRELRSAAEELDHKALALMGEEERPGVNRENQPAKKTTLRSLQEQLGSLLAAADTADASPTEQLQRAFADTRQQLDSQLQACQELLQKQVAEFNDLAKKSGATQLQVRGSE